MPSIAELRAETQPDWLLARPGAEHWAGRLYMRRLSPYLTRLILRTPLSANGVTALMIPAGLLGALSFAFAGIWPAVLGVLLVQLQLLLDCSDGEVARWRKQFSPVGVYLDQLAHYSTEAAIPAAIGVRADGGWDSIGGWTALGLLASVLILFLKSETHLVQYALGRSDRPAPSPEPDATPAPLPASYRPSAPSRRSRRRSSRSPPRSSIRSRMGSTEAGFSSSPSPSPQGSLSSGTWPRSSHPAASSEGTPVSSD